MVFAQQPVRGLERVVLAFEQVQDHRVRHLEGGAQGFRGGVHDLLERLLTPADKALRRLLLRDLAQLGGTLAVLLHRLGHRPGVLDRVLGGLDQHGAGGVEPGAPGPPGDLVEFAGVQQPGAGPVELGQRGDHHGADRHVDAHPQGVGAADDLQQPGLRQLLDQAAVLGQHPGVVHPDAVAHQAVQGLAEPGGEAEPADQLRDLLLLLTGGDVDAHQPGGAVDRVQLGEVHNVDRHLAGLDQLVDRLLHGVHGVVEVQRDRAFGVRDGGGLPPGAFAQFTFEAGHIAQGGAHQQELGLGQLDQRHLPGPAALRVGVEVEFVHHHHAHIGARTLTQRNVGQDLGGAADDRRIRVHRRIPGEHPDVLGAEDLAQIEELLRNQRLDRRGVEADLVAAHGVEVGGDRHQRLARTGRGGQDDVVPRHQVQGRLILGGVEGDSAVGNPAAEGLVDFLVGDVVRVCRQQVSEHHDASSLTVANC